MTTRLLKHHSIIHMYLYLRCFAVKVQICPIIKNAAGAIKTFQSVRTSYSALYSCHCFVKISGPDLTTSKQNENYFYSLNTACDNYTNGEDPFQTSLPGLHFVSAFIEAMNLSVYIQTRPIPAYRSKKSYTRQLSDAVFITSSTYGPVFLSFPHLILNTVISSSIYFLCNVYTYLLYYI